jgi:hypothetical protein
MPSCSMQVCLCDGMRHVNFAGQHAIETLTLLPAMGVLQFADMAGFLYEFAPVTEGHKCFLCLCVPINVMLWIKYSITVKLNSLNS